MHTLTLRSRVRADGTLDLHLNTGLSESDVEVVVVVQPVAPAHPGNGAAEGSPEERVWPAGYFERVVGSIPDLRRWEQGDFEEREPLG